MVPLQRSGMCSRPVTVGHVAYPDALRLALQRPEAVTAIISQSGNAYVEGLGQGFWGGVEKVWANPTPASVEALKNNVTSFDTTKWQVRPPNPPSCTSAVR